MRRLLAGAVLGALVAVAVAPAAGAASRHHPSTITFQIAPGADSSQMFFGKVDSQRTACWFDREVDVLQGGPGVTPKLVGADITSTNGDFLVTIDAPQAGYYRAVAIPKTYKRHGVRHVCDAGKSARILDA